MLVWFVVIGTLGIVGIARGPAILAALSPFPAINYLWHAGPLALVVIGGAFLAVTGGEAFYADMGHFGPLPIRIAGCGGAAGIDAQLFRSRRPALDRAGRNREFLLPAGPEWSHYGLVTLATIATVIASQSIISGAYFADEPGRSTRLSARMQVIHTARQAIGQIYVPAVNWLLAFGTLAAVIRVRLVRRARPGPLGSRFRC